jgi:DNA-binding GntR family transcriptional regulator
MKPRRHLSVVEAALREPQESPTISQSIAQRLKGLIIEGQLPPGTLLRLAEIADRLGVSVMPVRDALRLLEADKYVVLTPRRGAIVAELSVEDAEEIYAMRVALESLAARHAAGRLTAVDIAEIREAFGRMAAAQRSGDLPSFIEADHDFHQRLYFASGRDRLIRSISELVDRSRRYSPYAYRSWQPLDIAMAAHQPLLSAIEARQPDAVAALTEQHMAAAARRLVAEILRETNDRVRAQASRGRRRRGLPDDDTSHA